MSHCPWCHATLTRHSGSDIDHRPAKGDVSICWYCSQLAVYEDDEGTLRMPDRDEYEKAITHPEVRKALHLTNTAPSLGAALRMWRSS